MAAKKLKSYDSDDEFDDLDDPPGFWEEASQLSAVWEDSFDVLATSPDKSKGASRKATPPTTVSCPPAVNSRKATPPKPVPTHAPYRFSTQPLSASVSTPQHADAGTSDSTKAAASPPSASKRTTVPIPYRSSASQKPIPFSRPAPRTNADAPERLKAGVSERKQTGTDTTASAPLRASGSTTSHIGGSSAAESAQSRRIAAMSRSISAYAFSQPALAADSSDDERVAHAPSITAPPKASSSRRIQAMAESISAAFPRRGTPSPPVRPVSREASSTPTSSAPKRAPYQRAAQESSATAPPRASLSHSVSKWAAETRQAAPVFNQRAHAPGQHAPKPSQRAPEPGERAPVPIERASVPDQHTLARTSSMSSESSWVSTCPPSPVFDSYPSRSTTMESIDPDMPVTAKSHATVAESSSATVAGSRSATAEPSSGKRPWTDAPHISSSPRTESDVTILAAEQPRVVPARSSRPTPHMLADDEDPDPNLALPEGTTTRPMVFPEPKSVPDGVLPLSQLFGGRLTKDLTPVIIAHDRQAQAVMDSMDVPWGVQYELARGVLAGDWSWDDVTRERLLALRALSPDTPALSPDTPALSPDTPALSNERHAPRVREALLGKLGARSPKTTRVAAFRELDLEQAALVEGKGRGLGLMGPWEEQGSAEDYFGGKIQQVVRLTREGEGKGKGKGAFKFWLLPMQAQRRSYRLARRLGSRRILQVRLDKEYGNQNGGKDKGKAKAKEGEEEEEVGVAEFLAQSKFVLCGRVFVPYASKDGSAYLVEVDEDYERKARVGCGDQYRLSLEKLIESENPWVMNCNQPITKWVTRFSLSFSTSLPAIEFAEENMFLIEDEYVTGWDRSSGSPPAEQTMTDGCGFINRAALTDIGRRFSLPHGMPTAVQGRVAGAKGMFLLHPYDKHPEPRVWIRDSQNKIKLPKLERWHRILDLLKFAQQPNPEGFDLSEQAVLNLSHNGVLTEDFTILAQNGLRERAAPLLNWTQPAGALWKAVSDIGNVTGSRRVRGSQVMHRLVSGYRQTGADEDLPTGDEDQMEAALTGRDPYSGAPRSVHEQVVEMLQAGFKPQECEYLRIKMKKVLDMVCQSAVEDYRVPVPDSRGLNAFVVPDPLGVLNEDEIFYMPSPSFMDPKEQVMVQAVEGEVIVGRYPIRLPSDLRKVKAVNRPALHQYTNVIIVPTVGERSLVSLLSGGDCDGDILFMLRGIFTKNFVNRPYSEPPPDFMTRNFEKERETIADFCGRVSRYDSHAEKQAALARVFLAELGDSKVGIYSMYHDMAIAEHGYGAPETVRIAHMFNTLLDAKKTGVRVKAHVLVEDMKRYKGEVPETKKPHVLRALRSVARQTKGEVLSEFAQMSASTSDAPDSDLLEPRRRCLSVPCLANEVAVLDARVQAIHAEWLNKLHGPEQAWKLPGHIELDEPQKKKKRKRKPGEAKEDDMLVVTRAFASVRNGERYTSGGDEDNLQLLRATRALDAVLASCAYTARPAGYYAFTVAFGELCRAKAKAVGDVACIRSVDEVKTIPSSALPYLMGEDDDDGW